ncbi:MAG: hypothetical protein WCS20_07980 [Alphaproteobacteria bacterium]
MRIQVKDEVTRADGKRDIGAIRPLARLGYHDHMSVTEVFDMAIPGPSAETAAGLEGKA